MLNFNKVPTSNTPSKLYLIIACVSLIMLLMFLLMRETGVLIEKNNIVSDIITGFFTSLLLFISTIFSVMYLYDCLIYKNNLINLFRKEHKTIIEPQQIELNKKFEHYVKWLLEFKKSQLDNLSDDVTLMMQQSSLNLEEYNRAIDELKALQNMQKEIITQSNNLAYKFQLYDYEYSNSLKFAQDDFVRQVMYERDSYSSFYDYLKELSVGLTEGDGDEPLFSISPRMIYINNLPPIVSVFKSASALLTVVGRLEADNPSLFSEYCQRFYNFDCKMALTNEISLSNTLRGDSRVYNDICDWIYNAELKYNMAYNFVTAKRRYCDSFVITRDLVSSSIDEFSSIDLDLQDTEYKMDRIFGMSSPVIEQLAEDLNVLKEDRQETLDNFRIEVTEELEDYTEGEVIASDKIQHELSSRSLGMNIVRFLQQEEALKALIEKRRAVMSSDGLLNKAEETLSYIKMRFDAINSHIAIQQCNLHKVTSEILSLLNEVLNKKRFIKTIDIRDKASHLFENLSQEENDQIELIQEIKSIVEQIVSITSSTENTLLKSLHDDLLSYLSLLNGMEKVFSVQELVQCKVKTSEEFLDTGQSNVQEILDVLYKRYDFLTKNFTIIQNILFSLDDIETINSMRLPSYRYIEQVYDLSKNLIELQDRYDTRCKLIDKLEDLLNAQLQVKDVSSYLHLLSLSDDEKRILVMQLSKQEKPVLLFKLLEEEGFTAIREKMTEQLNEKKEAISQVLSTFIEKKNQILEDQAITHLLNGKPINVRFIDHLERLADSLKLLSNEDGELIYDNGDIEEINTIVIWLKKISELLYNKTSAERARSTESYFQCLNDGFLTESRLFNVSNLKEKIQALMESPSILEQLSAVGYQFEEDQIFMINDLHFFLSLATFLKVQLNDLHKGTLGMILEIMDIEKQDKELLINTINQELRFLISNDEIEEMVDIFLREEHEELVKLNTLQSSVSKVKEEYDDIEVLLNKVFELLPDVQDETKNFIYRRLKNITPYSVDLVISDLRLYRLPLDEKLTKAETVDRLKVLIGCMIDDIDKISLPNVPEQHKRYRMYEEEVALHTQIKSDLEKLQEILQKKEIQSCDIIEAIQGLDKNVKRTFSINQQLSRLMSFITIRNEEYKKILQFKSYVAHFLSFIKLLVYCVVETLFFIRTTLVIPLDHKIHQQTKLVSCLKVKVKEKLNKVVKGLLSKKLYYPKDLKIVRMIKKKLIDHGIVCDAIQVLEDGVENRVKCSMDALEGLMLTREINYVEQLMENDESEKRSCFRKLQLYKVIKKFMDNSVDKESTQYLEKINVNSQQGSNTSLVSFCEYSDRAQSYACCM
ncbi:hypothetical protein [Ehrlichia canis]|uniref:Uncharacterized protein n=1 Tax=Ehrlichia canis (strain Jake) TaxID=269484 RepID=A0ACA6AVV4_EHRCJ|nr:hypothetical protein [Ehrlichia canis]AAZ68500.1 hypothetical protein Ecaj_0463 [Ehrlichia canis str. Jake]AUO54754.1 hypothetical protein C1I72_02510 [Ehrlichia canis]UKC52971.1 hypothetical protein s20019040002_000012 [Ehrlichia canis]UKC53908.1 hypothetical protein s20026770001_000012 [Ehrlichia canis]UKC54844.1 hypothetical protein s21009500007_000012 [Ehrlichia canis]